METQSSSTAEQPPPRFGADYFKLFGASVISNLGDGIAAVAYPWLASAITRDPLLIALVAVVQRFALADLQSASGSHHRPL